MAIINRVGSSNYSIWTIGLTHDPAERKQQHENEGKSTTYWQQWTADSLSDAQDIESYFINEKGMKGGTGGDLSSRRVVFVYIS
jgi:predicted GIY-YIG superfamily endonuclease